jgi:hypothetical protein
MWHLFYAYSTPSVATDEQTGKPVSDQDITSCTDLLSLSLRNLRPFLPGVDRICLYLSISVYISCPFPRVTLPIARDTAARQPHFPGTDHPATVPQHRMAP